MYQLLHNGDIARVNNEEQGSSALSEIPFSTAQARSHIRLTLDNWQAFVSGEATAALPESPILDSWKRCKRQGVDPWQGDCGLFVPMERIQKQADLLTSLGHSVENNVYEAIKDRDLLLTFANTKGQILRTIGNKKVLTQADSLRFGPGSVWAEDSVGTNAISLALETQTPWHLKGEEHFCQSHHTWACSATPIFSPLGDLWGCVDISGHVSCDHKKALWLTMVAARDMERLLLAASLDNVEQLSRDMFKATLGALPVGLCIINEKGLITFANTLAEQLLNVCQSLRGQRADRHFALTQADLTGKDLSGKPVACLANPRLYVELLPFVLKGQARHALVTIRPEKPRQNLFAVPQGASGTAALPDPWQEDMGEDPFAEILHQSTAMKKVVAQARNMARSLAPVLILGETGTGKELFAKALHKASARADKPFVALNCGALPRDLIQSELFGYERGSFTGASRSGQGKFEQAHEGTLFLDEISEMPLDMQVNLLRPLETHRVTRVGGKQSIPTDFRLVTATNKNLEELVAEGRFREDLFYRIHVLTLELPPLRERKGDITLMAMAFGRKLAAKHNLPFADFSSEALACLESYDWPGNVRQLVHSIEYAVNMAMGARILPEHLPKAVCANMPGPRQAAGEEQDFSLENMEKRTIEAALRHYNGNILQAARALAIGRNTLYAKIRKYNISC